MKKIYTTLLILSLALANYAQAPWEVNSSDFEFSMNITGRVKLENNEINESNSWLGAFVGNECRGVVKATEVSSGEYLYFLTIYSNISSEEKVQFKMQRPDGTIHAFTQSVLFLADAIYGSPDEPYLWMLPEEFSQTDFLSFNIKEQVDDAQIDTENRTIDLKVSVNTDISNQVADFEVPCGAQVFINDIAQVSGTTSNDFTNALTYTITGIDGTSADWTVSVSIATYSVTFTISDGESVISGASISINNETLTSAETGLATIDLQDGSYSYEVTATNYETNTGNVEVDGAVQEVKIILQLTTDIGDLENDLFNIYPNPAKNNFTVEFFKQETTFDVEFIDMSGKVIFSKHGNRSKSKFDISGIDKGVYVCRVISADGIYKKKILVL